VSNFVVDLSNFCGDNGDSMISMVDLIVGGEIYGDYFDFHGEIYRFGSNMAAMVVVSWWCSLKKKQLNDMENFSQNLTWHLMWQ